jgi:hypothetical protein
MAANFGRHAALLRPGVDDIGFRPRGIHRDSCDISGFMNW